MWIVLLMAVAAFSSACAAAVEPSAPEENSLGAAEPAFINGEPCPKEAASDLPRNSGCVTSVGHGGNRLTLFASLDRRSMPDDWHLRLIGPDVDVEQDFDPGADYPIAVGGSDVDDDGTTEWWIQIGDYASHGAPWAYMHLFVSDGDGLVPLMLNGEPMRINYGGITRMGEGAECSGGRLVLLRAEAQNDRNTRWIGSRRTYEIEGAEAVFVDRTQKRITIDNYVDPQIRKYFKVECNGETFIPY